MSCSESQSKKSGEPAVLPAKPGQALAAESPVVEDGHHSDTAPWRELIARVDSIVYRFHDSSVPPQYHRSYTITAVPGQIDKKIDSYGDIISESGNAISSEQFAQLQALLAPLGTSARTPGAKDDGCTGGTGNSLRLMIGEREIFNEYLSECGSSPESALHTQVKAIGHAASAMVIPSASPRED